MRPFKPAFNCPPKLSLRLRQGLCLALVLAGHALAWQAWHQGGDPFATALRPHGAPHGGHSSGSSAWPAPPPTLWQGRWLAPPPAPAARTVPTETRALQGDQVSIARTPTTPTPPTPAAQNTSMAQAAQGAEGAGGAQIALPEPMAPPSDAQTGQAVPPGGWPADSLSRKPRLLGELLIPYPEGMGPQPGGRLQLRIAIDADGLVREVQSEPTELGPAFVAAATRSFLMARFLPAQRQGRAVPAFLHIEVRFDATDAP